MGFLIRLLLNACGRKLHSRENFSEVTKTIESIPGPKRNRWIYGGLIHLAPVVCVLLFLFLFRAHQIVLGQFEISAILTACSWAFVGPTLIWCYERYTLPKFSAECRTAIKNREDKAAIANLARENLYRFHFCRYFTMIWMCLVIYGFYESREFILAFGLTGYYDPLFWVLFFGVALIGFYTSIGFCFSYKAALLTRLFIQCRLNRKTFHEDGALGLTFMGDFAFRTALMFFSGWLFAPLIVLITLYQNPFNYSVLISLLGIYFVYTLLSFIVPIYNIRKKIVLEKRVLASEYYKSVNAAAQSLSEDWSDARFTRFKFYKSLILDLRSLPNWPLKLNVALKLLGSSILVPAITAIIPIFLKSYYKIGP